MVGALDLEFFDMARTDENSDWVTDSSPCLNLVACPSVLLVEGVIVSSNSGPEILQLQACVSLHVPVFEHQARCKHRSGQR